MKEFLVNLSWLWIWDSKKRREYRNNYRKHKHYKMPDVIPNHYCEKYIYSGQWGNNLISRELRKHNKKPYLISRFGAVELCCIKYALENIEKPSINFPENIKKLMKTQTGFFSANDEQLTRFACESIEAVKNKTFLVFGILMMTGRKI